MGTLSNFPARFVCAFLFIFSIHPLKAQEETITLKKGNSSFCSFSHTEEAECGKELQFLATKLDDDNFYYKEIEKALKHIGVKNNIQLYSTTKKGVEGYFIKEHEDNLPKIIINKLYLKDTAIALVIVFHELGHYLNDNENLCSNPTIELDADQFSGVYMAKFNENKGDCLRCYDVIAEGDGKTHPFRAERKERFLKGWNDGLRDFNINSFTSINPSVIWQKKGSILTVEVDEKQFSFTYYKNKLIRIKKGVGSQDSIRYDDEIGLVYIPFVNSTYQLINPQSPEKRGIGRLVNDKTAITYIRYGDKFRYFNGGIEVKIFQTSYMNFDPINPRDFFVEFTEENSSIPKKVIFKNYAYSKDIGLYIQPAIYH